MKMFRIGLALAAMAFCGLSMGCAEEPAATDADADTGAASTTDAGSESTEAGSTEAGSTNKQ